MEPSDALRSFRHSLYECLHPRGDALFELTDAILTIESWTFAALSITASGTPFGPKQGGAWCPSFLYLSDSLRFLRPPFSGDASRIE